MLVSGLPNPQLGSLCLPEADARTHPSSSGARHIAAPSVLSAAGEALDELHPLGQGAGRGCRVVEGQL